MKKNKIQHCFSCDLILCDGLPHPTRHEILTKSKGVDAILWATQCKLDAEALDAAGKLVSKIYSLNFLTNLF